MICCLCGDKVNEPLTDEIFTVTAFNAHKYCWEAYQKWYEEYTLHNKHFAK